MKFIKHFKPSKAQSVNSDRTSLQDILARIKAAANTPREDAFGCTLIIEDIQPCHIEDLAARCLY
jgi:hypothetical protein